MNVIAWHFLADDGRLRDGRMAPADGETLKHSGDLVIGKEGLHACLRAIDALDHAPGSLVCRVICSGRIMPDVDLKTLASSNRRILWRADATQALRGYARWCALSVAHSWEMPSIVRRYLETGRERLRAASERSARVARVDAYDGADWRRAYAAESAYSASQKVKSTELCGAVQFLARAAARSARRSIGQVARLHYEKRGAEWIATANLAAHDAMVGAESDQNTKLEELLLELEQVGGK